MSEEAGTPDESGAIVLPEKLPLSGGSLAQNGAYLVENGEAIVLFLGGEIDPAFLQAIFGINTLAELPADTAAFEEEFLTPNGNPLKEKFLNVVDCMRREVDLPHMPFLVTHHGRRDLVEKQFWDMLIEVGVEKRSSGRGHS